ncbi:MAG: TetR/AcrR family transcriptional regulator [Fimbriimonadales bacterium]
MKTVSRPYANRRERRREETRQRLIEAALALMQEKPFEQVTVEEITTLADVAKGTFFTYFPTKEHLLHAYMRDLANEVYEFLESLQPEDAPSQWEIMRQVMLFIAQRDARSLQISRTMMIACCHSPVVREQMLAIVNEATERARIGFEIGQQKGEFRTDVSAEELAHQAIRLYRLCQMEWMMEREGESLEQIVERVLEFYKPAFLAPRSTDTPVHAEMLGQECPSHDSSTDTPVRAEEASVLGQECPSHDSAMEGER